MEKLIYTKEEVAAIFSVSTRFIELLVAAKAIPAPFYLGDMPRWKSTTINALIEGIKDGQVISPKAARLAC